MAKLKGLSRFTWILFVIGFMLAIQYNTIQSPAERDTRDVWEIRKELVAEKQYHSELLTRIRESEELASQYEETNLDRPERLVEESISQLRRELGLEAYSGPGFLIHVEPSAEAIAFGQTISPVSPDLLVRFVNELNRFQVKAIEIDEKRLVFPSAIRDINGRTTMNTLPIRSAPFEIRVGTDSIEIAERVINQIQASGLADDFYIDNLQLTIEEPIETIDMVPYDQPISVTHLSEWKEGEN